LGREKVHMLDRIARKMKKLGQQIRRDQQDRIGCQEIEGTVQLQILSAMLYSH